MSPIKMRQAHLPDKIKTEIGPSSPYTKDSADTNGEKTTDSPPPSNEIDIKLRKTTSEKQTLRPPNASPNSRNKDTKSSTKRTENWANGEKLILLRLVKTKREIIETKHRNKDAKEQRNKAWDQIITELKSKCPRFANISTNCVKEQYQRLKSQVKKYLTKPDDSKTSGEAYQNIAIVKLMCDICQEEFKDFKPTRNDDEDDDTSDRNMDKPQMMDECDIEDIHFSIMYSSTSDKEIDFPDPNPKKDPSRTTNHSPSAFTASSPGHVKLESTNSNRIAENPEQRLKDQIQLSYPRYCVVNQNPYKLEIGKHNDVQAEKVLSTDIDIQVGKSNIIYNRVHPTEKYICELNTDELKNLRDKHPHVSTPEINSVIRPQTIPHDITKTSVQELPNFDHSSHLKRKTASNLSEIKKINDSHASLVHTQATTDICVQFTKARDDAFCSIIDIVNSASDQLKTPREEYVSRPFPEANYYALCGYSARPFKDEYNILENHHRLVKSKDDLSVTYDDLQNRSRPDSTNDNTEELSLQEKVDIVSKSFVPYHRYRENRIYSQPKRDRDKSSSDFSPTKKPRALSPVRTQQFSSIYYPLMGKPQISRSSSQSFEEQFDNEKDKQDKTEINSFTGPYEEDIDIHKETLEMRPANTTISTASSLNRNLNKRNKNLKCFVNTKRRYEIQELRLQKEKHVEELRMAREKHEIEMEMLRLKKQALEHQLQQVIKSTEQPSQHTSQISDPLISEERLSKRMPNTSGIFTTTQEILNDTSCTLYNF